MTVHAEIRFLIIFAILSIIFTAGFGVGIFLQWRELSTASGWVGHTNNVLSQIKDTAIAIKDADLTGRLAVVGFVNGDLQRSRDAANAHLDLLGEISSDNQEQALNLKEIREAVKTRFEFQDTLFNSVQVKDGKVVQTVEQSLKSLDTTGRLEAALNTFRAAELTLAHQRYGILISHIAWLVSIFIVGLALAIILLIFTFISAYRSLSVRKRAVDKVAEIRKAYPVKNGIDDLYALLEGA